MSKSLSPYRGIPKEDLVNISVYVPRLQYEQLMRTCLGHGDMPGYLAYAFGHIVREIQKQKLNIQYEPTHRETVRTIVAGIRFGCVAERGLEHNEHGRTDGDGETLPTKPREPARDHEAEEDSLEESDRNSR
jgi:hypothetical protein